MRYNFPVAVSVLVCMALLIQAAYVQEDKSARKVNDVVCIFIYLVELVVGAIASIVIIFMGVKYQMSGNDSEGRSMAKNGIIAAFMGVVIIVITVPVVNIISSGVLGLVDCGYLPSMEKTAQSTTPDQKDQEAGKSDQAIRFFRMLFQFQDMMMTVPYAKTIIQKPDAGFLKTAGALRSRTM